LRGSFRFHFTKGGALRREIIVDSIITCLPDKTTVVTGEFITEFKGRNHHAAIQISILQQQIWEMLHPEEQQMLDSESPH
jgi:hypothetical protein